MSKGKSLGNCRTCGGEIVELSNEGVFGQGECEHCERDRYQSHSALLAAASAAYGALCDLSYHPCFRWNRKRFQQANETIDILATALNAYGKEQ